MVIVYLEQDTNHPAQAIAGFVDYDEACRWAAANVPDERGYQVLWAYTCEDWEQAR